MQELVKSEQVRETPLLNATAIFTFTELVRVAHVDRKNAHNRYPVHTFGPLTEKDDKVVTKEYIPWMTKHLHKAVQDQDSQKIQVFVRALGNIAHPAIVPALEPFLNGKEPMTTFQRTHLIVSMDKLARTYPRLARSILYKVYTNQAENYQVRVAAVFGLMMTNPPLPMIQRMAQSTRFEPSTQVVSVIQTTIESQAQLTGEFNSEM